MPGSRRVQDAACLGCPGPVRHRDGRPGYDCPQVAEDIIRLRCVSELTEQVSIANGDGADLYNLTSKANHTARRGIIALAHFPPFVHGEMANSQVNCHFKSRSKAAVTRRLLDPDRYLIDGWVLDRAKRREHAASARPYAEVNFRLVALPSCHATTQADLHVAADLGRVAFRPYSSARHGTTDVAAQTLTGSPQSGPQGWPRHEISPGRVTSAVSRQWPGPW